MGQALLKANYIHGPENIVVGTGGDFDEFGLSVLRKIDPAANGAVGCLWPVRGSDPNALFFEQQYFEQEAYRAPFAILAISVANDYILIKPLLRRVRELLPHASLIVVAACASEEVNELLKAEGVTLIARFKLHVEDIDYWKLVSRLDTRELKIIPRMTYWLVNRMEKRTDLREEHALAQQAAHMQTNYILGEDEEASADDVEHNNPAPGGSGRTPGRGG